MNFDVIICTYNRPLEVIRLIAEIQGCNLLPEKIIIVDSSDHYSIEIAEKEGVCYIKSSHKNQPYQRYLGCRVSTSDLITFFDDDLKITDKNIFNYLTNAFAEQDVVGSCVGLAYEELHNEDRTKKQVKGSGAARLLLSLMKMIAIGKRLKPGEMWLLGMDTPKNEQSYYVEYIGGGDAPTFKREITDELFDDFLFSLYEKKLGKGEDKYLL